MIGMTYSVSLLGDEIEALDRRKHGNRGRDDRVAREQRGAGDAEQKDEIGAASDAPSQRRLRQRHQRQNAALAAIVRPHQEHDIFGRHRENKRVEQQRNRADHRFFRQNVGLGGVRQQFAQRVKRAGADVAIDDADRADDHRGQSAAARSGGRIGRAALNGGVRGGGRLVGTRIRRPGGLGHRAVLCRARGVETAARAMRRAAKASWAVIEAPYRGYPCGLSPASRLRNYRCAGCAAPAWATRSWSGGGRIYASFAGLRSASRRPARRQDRRADRRTSPKAPPSICRMRPPHVKSPAPRRDAHP